MEIIIRNISELALTEIQGEEKPFFAGELMSGIQRTSDAWIHIRNGYIEGFGHMSDYPDSGRRDMMTIDASGCIVLPAWCDSHTHLVYPGSRELEFVDKIKGLSYEEIARRGGGILNSARKLQHASEEELMVSAMKRLNEIIAYGTGAVEIKSGYGLTPEGEIKMLRVIQKLKAQTPLTIRATFLGAHSIPMEYRSDPDRYVDQVVEEMIPQVGEEQLADFIDVFCDKGFFTPEQTARILEAGAKYGMRPKIHANELAYSGGIQVGVKHHALSVDHLEYTGDEEIAVLKGSGTMPTILPGAAFFLGMPLAPARAMIDAGLPLALASDYNPGSSPSGNMQLILSMACIQYHMLPEEAITASTLNGAYAMGLHETHGSIAIGKKANIIISQRIPSLEYIPYAFGANKVDTVILNGVIVRENKC